MATMEDTESLIRRLKLPEHYVDVLRYNGYNFVEDFADMTANALKDLGISLPGHRRRIMNNIKQIITKESKSSEVPSGGTNYQDDSHTEEGIYQFPNSYNSSNLPGMSGIEHDDRDDFSDAGLSRAGSMFGTVNYNRPSDSSDTTDQYDSLDRNRKLSLAPQSAEINHSVDQSQSGEDLIYDSPPRLRYYGRNNTETEDAYQCPGHFGERSQSTVETWNRSEDSGVKLQYETSESLPLPPTRDMFARGNFENDRFNRATDLSDTGKGINSMIDISQIGTVGQGQCNNLLSTNPPKPVPRKRSSTPTDPSKFNTQTHASQTDESKQKSLLPLNENVKTHNYENVDHTVLADPQRSLTDDCDSNFLDNDIAESVYEIFTQKLKLHSDSMQQNPGVSQSQPETESAHSSQQPVTNETAYDDESDVYKRLQAPQPADIVQPRTAFKDFDDEYNLLDRSSISTPLSMYPQPSPESNYDYPPRQSTQEENQVSNYDYPPPPHAQKDPELNYDYPPPPQCTQEDPELNYDYPPPPQCTQEEPELNYDYPPQQYPQQSTELNYDFPQSIPNQTDKPPPTPSDDLYHEASFVEEEYDNSDNLNVNGLAMQQNKQTPADVQEDDTYEETNFPMPFASHSHSNPTPPVRSRNRIFSEQASSSKPAERPSTETESQRRVSRSRAGGISFYGGFTKDRVEGMPNFQKMRRLLRSGREKKQDRPVSVCMQSDTVIPGAEERTRTHSSTLNRQQYNIPKKHERDPDAYKQLMNLPDQQAIIPVSPLKKVRTKSGWLWKQPISESKVPPRKRWAIFDGVELVYYVSDTKLDFSKGILPVRMMLKLDVPNESQTSFHLLMKGGKTYIFQTESREERVIWTSTLMAAILTFQKETATQLNPGGDMSSPYKQGHLKMDGIKQKVFVALKNDKVAYYKTENDFMFAQPITRVVIRTASMRDVGRCKFQLVFPSKAIGFTAERDDEKMSWMAAFQLAISGRLSGQQGGAPSVRRKPPTSLRDHLFKFGGDFKVANDNKKRNKLQMFKSALQTGDFQRRLCTLECSVLSYCDAEKPHAVKDSFSCSELVSVTVHTPDIASKAGFNHCFELSRKSGRTYLFCAEKPETRIQWTSGIAQEITPDNVQSLLPANEDFDKAGPVKLKVEPLSVLDSVWKNMWCYLRGKNLHLYDESAPQMETLDLRKLTEITVTSSQDPAPFDYSSLAPTREAIQSIILSFGDKFYFIQSETKADTDSWLAAFKRADSGSGPTLEDMQLTSDGVPIVVQKCLSYVERHGMDTRGIYRLSGTHSKTSNLLSSFQNNARETSMMDNLNVHDVSNAFKRWCKSLSGSILTSHLYTRWIDVAGSNHPGEDHKLERYRQLVKALPQRHKLTLKAILEHLVRVSMFEKENDMTLHNLAIVFGPTLMGVDDKDCVGDTAKQIGCIEDLLVNFDNLFQGADSEHSWSDKSSHSDPEEEDVYQNIEDVYDYP